MAATPQVYNYSFHVRIGIQNSYSAGHCEASRETRALALVYYVAALSPYQHQPFFPVAPRTSKDRICLNASVNAPIVIRVEYERNSTI